MLIAEPRDCLETALLNDTVPYQVLIIQVLFGGIILSSDVGLYPLICLIA